MALFISFIIPVYKVEEQYLLECINSLIRIKTEDVEFIFIDDGSPDNAGAICDKYSRVDSRVRVFHKDNEGVSIARNTGIKCARGKYVTFIDADDWIDSEEMDLIIDTARETDCDLYIFGQYINYRNSEKVILPFIENRLFKSTEDFNRLKGMVFVREYDTLKSDINSGVMCNAVDKIIKKSIIEEHQLFYDPNIKMGEDALFNLKLLNHCNSALFISVCAYHYRMRKTSVNHSNKSIGYGNGTRLFMNQVTAYLEEINAPDRLKDAAYYRCFNLIFEQFDNAFMNDDSYSVFKKCKAFSRELNSEPYKTAIKNISIKELGAKEKLKAITLKLNLHSFFLIAKELRRKMRLNDKKELF